MIPNLYLKHYACIVKGSTMLAKFNSNDAMLGAIAAKCLDKTPLFHAGIFLDMIVFTLAGRFFGRQQFGFNFSGVFTVFPYLKFLISVFLKNMLLLLYLVTVLERDFMPRSYAYHESMNWTLLRDSLLNTLLESFCRDQEKLCTKD